MQLQQTDLDFSYQREFRGTMPEAYERLLLDALEGDASLFARADEVEAAWSICDPILAQWQRSDKPPLYVYEPGFWGPEESHRLDGHAKAASGSTPARCCIETLDSMSPTRTTQLERTHAAAVDLVAPPGLRDLPFARWGWRELNLYGWPLLAVTIAARCSLGRPWRWLAIMPARAAGSARSTSFATRRDACPTAPEAIVAPADGTVVEVTRLDHYDFLDGPAVRIGIFLSIFNVHINRAPYAGTRASNCTTNRANSSTPCKPESATAQRVDVDRLRRARLPARPLRRAADQRRDCPPNRLPLQPGTDGPPRREVWYDQAGVAHRADPARRRRRSPRLARRQGQSRQRHHRPLEVRSGCGYRMQGAGEAAFSACSRILHPSPMKPIRAVAVLPTLFTLGNLVCGFFAIVVLSRIEKPSRHRVRAGARRLSSSSTRPTS